MEDQVFVGTTIVSVRRNDTVALGGDGQVTLGNTIVKHKTSKVRRALDGKVLVGFAGAAADSLALLERFEGKLEQFHGNLPRAAVELAKEWRTDKYLRRLEALLAVCDKEHSLLISGTGEVIEPDDGIIAIGSGGPYALAAARALTECSDLGPKDIVERALKIAASICVYTNDQITVETL